MEDRNHNIFPVGTSFLRFLTLFTSKNTTDFSDTSKTIRTRTVILHFFVSLSLQFQKSWLLRHATNQANIKPGRNSKMQYWLLYT